MTQRAAAAATRGCGLWPGRSAAVGARHTRTLSNGVAVTEFHRGFRKKWFRNKEALLNACPGPVVVAQPYDYEAKDGEIHSARRYSWFESHQEYWHFIQDVQSRGSYQNLNEVLVEGQRRSLYFDLDGPPPFWREHSHIVDLLRSSLLWFFGHERRGWDAQRALQPVVLKGTSTKKYSTHVIFPEVQFDNFDHQAEYLNVYLSILPSLLVGGRPLLHQLVDCVPYMKWQLFRGPWACKMENGVLLPDTALEPSTERPFRDDPFTCFAGYANPSYSLELPPVEQLLSENEALLAMHMEHRGKILRAGGMTGQVNEATIFHPGFQTPRTGEADFLGLAAVEVFERSLELLHPDRASQWWSWFRICGVTQALLEQHALDATARQRILNAHMRWSSGYPFFDHSENIERIRRAGDARVSRLKFLVSLACFDNPQMRIRPPSWGICSTALPQAEA